MEKRAPRILIAFLFLFLCLPVYGQVIDGDSTGTVPAADVHALIQLHNRQVDALMLQLSSVKQQLVLEQENVRAERQRSEDYRMMAGAVNKSWLKKPETWISLGIAVVSVIGAAK